MSALPIVILVGHTLDEHCDYLGERLSELSRAKVMRVSQEDLPDSDLVWRPGEQGAQLGEVSLDRSASGLWRRPGEPQVASFQDEFAEFAASECKDAFLGMLETTRICWVTSPSNIIRAELKLVQLEAATRLGMPIPPTLVTNNADAAVAFARERRLVVVKPVRYGLVSSTKPLVAWASERSVGELIDLNGPPVIIQERIEAPAHLRVTTVGSETFLSFLSTPVLDWRSDPENHNRFVPLPTDRFPAVVSQAQRLCQHLRLGFSAQDWLVPSDRPPVFLEANPNGQWLFLESAHNGTIGRAFVELLLDLAGRCA